MRVRDLVAWNLRRLRVAKGVSQERLAFDAGVDRAYVGHLERGEMNPSIDTIEKLADTLDIKIAEFFVEPAEGETRPKPLRGGRRPRS